MKNLFKNWNAVRIMRLLFAIGFAIYAISISQYLFLIITIFLLLQVIFHNTLGCCCGGTSCSVDTHRNQEDNKTFKKV